MVSSRGKKTSKEGREAVSLGRTPLAIHRAAQDPLLHDKSHHLPNDRGFCNPWPSWSKPSLYDVWSGLRWLESDDDKPNDSSTSGQNGQSNQVSVEQPNFDVPNPDQNHARTWWLGHAGVLLELPTSTSNGAAIRVLFDPIFSKRCSPSQYVGPVRFTPAPCAVSQLPRIDVVIISHNHYDHMDADTISALWKRNKSHLRIVVPLGNVSWLKSLLGEEAESRICEMDWWDEATFASDDMGDGVNKVDEEAEDEADVRTLVGDSASGEEESLTTTPSIKPRPGAAQDQIRVVCTPAQHGSGRCGIDANCSLWASYTLFFHQGGSKKKDLHVFFGGDTGYRLRPPTVTESDHSLLPPACPAFAEIFQRFGPADLLLLPISVGSTYSYLRSWDPVGILPDVDGGLTAQNHLDEWEAIEVAKVLTGRNIDAGVDNERDGQKSLPAQQSKGGRRPLAVAIHFGTFSPPPETLRNVKRLQRACDGQGWSFLRGDDLHGSEQAWRPQRQKEDAVTGKQPRGPKEPAGQGDFLVLNHGGHVQIPLP